MKRERERDLPDRSIAGMGGNDDGDVDGCGDHTYDSSNLCCSLQ